MPFDIYDFTSLTQWIDTSLNNSLSPFWVVVVEMVIVGLLILVFYALIGLFLVYAERKVCAFMQNRLGPNRVGPFGVFQTIADLIKLLLVELVPIKNADKFLFNVAPFIVIIASFMAISAIPFAKGLHAIDLNIGVFYVIAVSAMGVIGILLAGWSSNNKYAMLGGVRATAQMISYELALALSVIGVLLVSGTLRPMAIVERQAGWFWNWNAFAGGWQLLGFLVFVIAGFAETNRAPFDLPEAESELVAGYHTEYSSMKFAMFFMSEYINMTTSAAMAVTLFLGGWQLGFPVPFSGWTLWTLQVAAFWAKVGTILLFFVWVRWTLPRFRYDHLMNLGWKGLFPLSLANVMLTAVLAALGWVRR